MNQPEFLNAYPRILADRYRQGEVGGLDMTTSRQWSHRYGEHLHDVLSGTEIDHAAHFEEAERYFRWELFEMPYLQTAADDLEDCDAGARITNELNFHRLNFTMFDTWNLYLDRDNPKVLSTRNLLLGSAQDEIAMMGLHLYAVRAKQASKAENYRYFHADNDDRRASIEGVAAEFDAAIVLLELMKKNPGFFALPAPMQFESRSRGERTSKHWKNNADFVVWNTEAVMGVQIKGFVQQKDVDEYNPERILLVDASLDLGNQNYVRTQHESTRYKRVHWGAQLCAERVNQIPAHGNKYTAHKVDPQRVMRAKFTARHLIGNSRPYLQRAVEIVGNRIAKAFENQDVTAENIAG